MPSMVCHRRGYGMGGIYGYRFSDTEKPIRVGRDKYRLFDTKVRTHVPPVSLDDASEARPPQLGRFDPRERAEERRGDHGRDRDDDTGLVADISGIRVSPPGANDPRRPAQEAGRWPVRAPTECERGDRVAVRHAGPEGADGR